MVTCGKLFTTLKPVSHNSDSYIRQMDFDSNAANKPVSNEQIMSSTYNGTFQLTHSFASATDGI